MRDAAQLGQKAVRDIYFHDSVSFDGIRWAHFCLPKSLKIDLFNCEQNWPLVYSMAQISLHIYI